jgi:hypothetical protein
LVIPSIAASEGLTLGGAAIQADGTWKGRWEDLTGDADGRLEVTVDPASAVVVQMP